MDHSEAEGKNIAEKYLKQELTPEEELSFEEHLLVCSLCRENVRRLEDIVDSLRTRQQQNFRKGENQYFNQKAFKRGSFYYIRIAAVGLFVAGISGLLFILFNDVRVKPKPALITENKNDTAKASEIDKNALTDRQNDIGKIAGNQTKGPEVKFGNFKPDMFYEKLVEENYRNTSITILSPLNDTLKGVPAFKWEGQMPEILTLKIIDNRENTIYQKPVRNGSFPVIDMKPGLYYWQLMSERETIVTGKFIYLRPSGR